MRQLLAFTACCDVAGGLLWESENPFLPCWKEAGTAFPFSGPWISFQCCGALLLSPEEVFTKGMHIESI